MDLPPPEDTMQAPPSKVNWKTIAIDEYWCNLWEEDIKSKSALKISTNQVNTNMEASRPYDVNQAEVKVQFLTDTYYSATSNSISTLCLRPV